MACVRTHSLPPQDPYAIDRKAFADNLPEIEGDHRSLIDAFLDLLTVAASAVGRRGTLAISDIGTDYLLESFLGLPLCDTCMTRPVSCSLPR